MSTPPFKKSNLIPIPSQVSELRGIIRSHSLPSLTLLSRSQNVVDNAPLELARYAIEIQTLEETLGKLKSERALLESYADECRSLFSPARRLPTELLVEIFDLCSPDFNSVDNTTTVEQEETRLAKIYLLRLSQVSFRWHDIVMNSPKLWSTITFDTTLWHKSTISSATLLAMLASSLKRGADFPLALEAAIDHDHSDSNHESVLPLLAQHSRRWKTVYLWVYPPRLRFLAQARGNLPILESLTLVSASANLQPTGAVDMFGVAPRLKTAEVHGWWGPLPWGQLLRLTIANGQVTNVNGRRRMLSLAMLPLLSNEIRCTLLVLPAGINLPLGLQRATSNIPSLEIGFSSEENRLDGITYLTRTGKILGEIFAALSLPSLSHLRVFRSLRDGLPPAWNAPRFLDFASRSMLCNTLRSFEVYSVVTDVELLESLVVLPLLEELKVGDCAYMDHEHITITDNLLHQLSWRSDQANLVPHLRVLSLVTLGAFTEESFLEFASSRIVPGRSDAGPFTANISEAASTSRKFSVDFFVKLETLEEERELRFDYFYA
ncbi:hypothetical protein B0H16DRAFT_1889595 [Mycena metata]|uniref:F-box domain-containing protein n=1 Tax=Mycena metata TaxID=1033252 RepID=A0AAD7IJM8_9AGAR|nr:hypothetical protein B0H16DRAFT_1889595 [Mycena metata]